MDPMKKINLLFNFILQSSPSLKQIDLSNPPNCNDINAHGGIHLNVRENHSL